MSSSIESPLAPLWARLDALTLRDRQRLQRRLQGAAKVKNSAAQQAIAAELADEFSAAEQRIARRVAGTPRITFPENLPVSQKQQAISDAIRDHQVVIVAGETGSGKTTQLPKICLALGRGVKGLIGHTQPRRSCRKSAWRWDAA